MCVCVHKRPMFSMLGYNVRVKLIKKLLFSKNNNRSLRNSCAVKAVKDKVEPKDLPGQS